MSTDVFNYLDDMSDENLSELAHGFIERKEAITISDRKWILNHTTEARALVAKACDARADRYHAMMCTFNNLNDALEETKRPKGFSASEAYYDALKAAFNGLRRPKRLEWTVVDKNRLTTTIPYSANMGGDNMGTTTPAQQPEDEEVLKNRIYRALVGLIHKSFVCEEDRAKAIAKYMVNDKGE